MMLVEVKQPPLCAICKKLGQRRAIERLPHNGILWRINHDDGTVCEWGRYKSFEDLRQPNEAYEDESIVEITCPRCNKIGKIGSYRKDCKNHPDKYDYMISHKTKGRYQKRCFMITQEQRDLVLKKLGRYIEQITPIKKKGIAK
jgi:hypothetical protein